MMAMMIFPRQGLGTHSVPDIEVLSTDPPDLMPLTGESIFLLLISLIFHHHHDVESFVHHRHDQDS